MFSSNKSTANCGKNKKIRPGGGFVQRQVLEISLASASICLADCRYIILPCTITRPNLRCGFSILSMMNFTADLAICSMSTSTVVSWGEVKVA